MTSKCLPKLKHRLIEWTNDEGEEYSECENCGRQSWVEEDLKDKECDGIKR